MLISWKRILRKKVCCWCVDQQAIVHKELAFSNIELLDAGHYLCAQRSPHQHRNAIVWHYTQHSIRQIIILQLKCTHNKRLRLNTIYGRTEIVINQIQIQIQTNH